MDEFRGEVSVLVSDASGFVLGAELDTRGLVLDALDELLRHMPGVDGVPARVSVRFPIRCVETAVEMILTEGC